MLLFGSKQNFYIGIKYYLLQIHSQFSMYLVIIQVVVKGSCFPFLSAFAQMCTWDPRRNGGSRLLHGIATALNIVVSSVCTLHLFHLGSLTY